MSEIQLEGWFFCVCATCLLLVFLSGGHQNGTRWVLSLFTFGFASLLSRCSTVLLLQLRSRMTGEYSYYKEEKIKNKPTPPANKSIRKNKP